MKRFQRSGRSLRRPARTASALIALTAVGAAATACGSSSGSDDATSGPGPSIGTVRISPGTPAPTAAPKVTWPLTGLAAPSSAATSRAPVTVAVALVGNSAPTGLTAADIVWQEAGGFGASRAVAIFQSHDATGVGPVTTTDPVDPKLVSLTKGAMAYSGGTPGFVKLLDASGVTDLSSTTHGTLYSTSTAPAPYNSVVSTTTLRSAGPATSTTPQLLAYGSAGQPLGSINVGKATQVTITIPGQQTEVWNYDKTAHQWVRMTTGAPTARVTNLVVQMAWYHKAYLNKYHGITISTPDVFGSGVATVFSGGSVVHGSWSRPGNPSTTRYTDTNHVPMRFAPGSTWVLLAPVGSTVSNH